MLLSCSNETFKEDDDEEPIREKNDHELLEALENMVLRASNDLVRRRATLTVMRSSLC